MSHKVHPKSYRLKELSDWDSRWLSKKNFSKYLEEDFKIREELFQRIGKLGVEKIEIERFPGKIIIFIFSSRPGLIIGRGGKGIEDLKKILEKALRKGKPSLVSAKKSKKPEISQSNASVVQTPEIKIEIKEIKDPWSSASLSGQWIAQQIERRIPHRRVLKQAIEKIMGSKITKGVKVEVAGRLGGAEIARREWLKKGRLPLQTIRADIDFAREKAHCSYGVIGVKVWIYKGEKF